MEKFLVPKKKTGLIKWLLEKTVEQKWIIVLEYEKSETYQSLVQNATEVNFPKSAKHNYHRAYLLTAINNPVVTNKMVGNICKNCSVLSLHRNDEMIFLAADDFHKDCFSCSAIFYNQYHQVLREECLIR